MTTVRAQDKQGSQLLKKALQNGGGELGVGAQQKAVRYLERALQVVGFDPGTKDNKFTSETARAVREFQAAWGLPVTGKLNAKTLAKLDHTLNRARKHGSGCPDCNQKGFQGAVGLGQKNADVFAAEQRLKKLGYDVGKVDGVFDRQTAAATKAFKADQQELKSKGSLIGKETFASLGREANALGHAPYRRRLTQGIKEHNRLNAATAEAAKKTLPNGETGIGRGSPKRWVKNVQAHLRAAGFDPKRTDGVFDERTENALRTFQRRSGVKETGRVGPQTWGKLRQSFFPAKDGTSPGQRVGERSAAVLRSEKLLRKLGYKKVKVDGVFDQATQKASRAFERRFNGLGNDGAIGDRQLQRMRQVARARTDPGSGPTLKLNFRGAPVRTLQRRLKTMGFNPGGTDGHFGPKTRDAVKRFQRAFGLKVDGIVGKASWRLLGVDAKGKVRRPGSVGGGGNVTAGGGWGGSQGVANTAKRIAAAMGAPVTSQKRNLADTIRVGSSTASDHYTGNTTAFAVDFGVSGSRGDELARRIAKAYGVSTGLIGTFNSAYINVKGVRYRVQILWRVAGHFDHVHVGIRRA
jgi:peptidoglycan hydrolase-like protein with peptidoglycan-binding domain